MNNEDDMMNNEYESNLEEIEQEDEDANIEKNDILSYNASYSLPEFSKKYEDKMFFRPDFQRNYIWDNKRKSKFIESLLFDYPVPPVFLYKLPKEERYMIIDGFQRISTINSFLNNKFVLKGVSTLVNKLSYETLKQEDKNILSNKQLNAVIIRQLKPNKKEILYNLFGRLNTGGQNLNNMEVRRAINYGPLMKMLEYLNENKNWRLILGKSKIDDRFLDMELLLRLLAFSEKWNDENKNIDGYTSTIKPFLNDYTEEKKNCINKNFEHKFVEVSEQIIEELGENPFKLYKKPNYVLLDSIFSALLIRKGKIENLKEKVYNLKQNHDFKLIYEAKQGTLSPKNVNARLKIALEYIK